MLRVVISTAWRRAPRAAPGLWTTGVVTLLALVGLSAAAATTVLALAAAEACYLHFDRAMVPDPGPLVRFEFPTIGRVLDRHGDTLFEFAHEQREITQYADLPPVVRDAILAAEDKRFFDHDGVDYRSLPRVLAKVRGSIWAARLLSGGLQASDRQPAMFPQGGSTITQQLVRGVYLRRLTAQENSDALRDSGVVSLGLSLAVGARTANMALRKREEMRLSLWLEQALTTRFGSKRRAKEEILARYASLVYMGHGQYGFARAAEYYVGRPLASFTAEDAAAAALLAGITKSPRAYAPDAGNVTAATRRRNRILGLMATNGTLTPGRLRTARAAPLPAAVTRAEARERAPAVVAHVIEGLAHYADLGIESLLQGRIDITTTVDAGVQRLANEALEHGLDRYEARRPSARGRTQGAVVVLRNDGQVLAEVGGRRLYRGRALTYTDYNRAVTSMRQPGSVMKPLVYLAALEQGDLTLDSLVPDEPISVPDARPGERKWIANYDGRYTGMIPLRVALAESRNAVAIWLATRIGIERVASTARRLGVQSPLQPYLTTALGASEVTLLELANVYRAIASGRTASPNLIQQIARRAGGLVPALPSMSPSGVTADADVLGEIQEGLRGVVRLPTGTAHALDAGAFPVPVMGKTGTTNDFRDALFVGSTFGPEGVTVAVRIGFDDNHSLGARETGGRVALPVFRELMLALYRQRLVGPVPAFPADMDERLDAFVARRAAEVAAAEVAPSW